MKKWLKTGKKALSVFMAVMMVMTAWVWVAPTEASAATAGTYDVKVRVKTTNSVDVGDDKDLTLTLNYKTNNGSGSAGTALTHNVSYTWAESDNADNSYTFENVAGYPTSLNIDVLFAWTAAITRQWDCTIYISIYNENTKAWDLVQENSLSKNGGSWGQTDMDFTVSSIGGTPTATSIKFLSGVDSIDIPKTGETDVSNTYTAGVYDQYGVRMTYEPTYYVRSSAPTSAQTSSNTISGVTMSSGTSSGTLKVTSDAQNTSADTKNIYVHAKYGSVYANKTVALNDQEYEFTYDKNTTDSSAVVSPSAATKKKYYNTFGDAAISGSRTGFTFINFYTTPFADSYGEALYSGTPLSSSTRYTADTKWYAAWQANKYKLTFNYKDENYTDKTYTVEKYYGQTYDMPDYPEVIEVKENGITNYKYEFKGWKVGNSLVIPPTTIPNENITYLADYEETIYYADKTNLNNAIAAAEAKLNEQKYIDGGYTEESVAAFESALQQADYALGMMYFLSQQSALDLITNSLVAATNNLTTKKYIVMFVDEDGTILKDGYHFVEYGERVDVPANPEQEPDADYHYEFVEWNSNLSDGLEACNKVTDNLRYIADFAAIPHTFTETKTDSTCTADGVITYTCDCGYSYTAVNPDDLAHHIWSTDYKELVPATCATKGSEAKYCTACGAIDESTRREIDELGHAFGAYTEYTPATCFGKGAEIATCSRCGGKDVRELAQKSHSYGAAEVVAKTCTADGYTKEVCTLCGFTNIRDIDITKGHTLKVETVLETCVSVGYAKTYCEKCDFERTTTYPATGWHSYPDTWETVAEASCVGHGVEKRVCTVCNSATETRLTALAQHTSPADWTTEVSASCDSEGRKVKDCTVCGKELEAATIAKLGHNYEAYADGTYDATCTTAGATAEKCSRCGDVNTTLIQPTGHSYKNEGAVTETAATCTTPAYKIYKCDTCGETKTVYVAGSTALTHDFTGTETIIKNADCENDGEKTVKCSRCDATTTVIIPKLGHKYGEWDKTTNPATNDKDGTWTRTCENCNDVETITIPKGGHNFVEDTSEYVAPTCNTKGQRVYKCDAHDNCIANVTVELDYAQHTIAQKKTPATCTTPGKVEAYCSVCDANCEKPFSTTETPVVPHTLDNGTAVAPTCTTSGYTTYKCTAADCDFSYNVYDESKPAIDHTYTSSVTKQPTCTTEGLNTFTCACGDSYTAPISPLGHNYTVTATTEATCTALATKTYECACGASYVVHEGTLAEHKFDELVKSVPATNDSLGYEERKCDCGLTEITILEATGTHIFNEKIEDECIAPTCTENGTDVYKCTAHTDCGAKSSVLIPRLGHTVKAVYNAPTCIAEGSSEAYCTTCDSTIASEKIPVIGYHNFSGEGEVTIEPTCVAEGEMTYTCLTDGCTATKTEAIPAKGHVLTTTVTDAKCGEKGSVVTVCANCDDPAVEKTTELAAKGHIWGDTPTDTVDATCTTDGSETYKCVNCDEENVVVLPKLGHTWGDWTVTPSTNDAPGSVSRECLTDGCDATETIEIPAGGHNLVVDENNSTDATCKAEGKLVYICDNHNDCGITVTVTVPKTQHTVNQREILATCKVEGKVEAYCSVCRDVLSTETIPVKAHEYTAGTAVAPTCTTSGYTPYTCACGDTYNKYDASKPATGHTLVEGASTADCTTAGQMTLTCENCTYSTTVKVPAKGHNYEKQGETVAATCNSPATETYKCTTCGDTYIKYVSDKTTTHTYIENWTVVKSATESSIGYKTRECTVCGQLEVETIPATGDHQFTVETDDKKPATCEEDGYIVYACATNHNCERTSKVILPKLGHSEALEYTPADCDTKGSTKRVCTVCKKTLEEKEIPALGHLYGDGTVTPATCNTKGSIVYECTRTDCNETKTVQIDKNANAHQYETVVTDATCYKVGSVVTKCALCDDITTNKELPMIEHTWNAGEIKEGDAATCTTDGKKIYTCSVCSGTKEETIDKLGHDWGEWAISKEATNTDAGEFKRTCNRTGCDASETIVIPAGDHEWDEGTVTKEASCTETGTKVYKCKTHTGANACGVEITITLDKLQHDTEVTYNEKATCEGTGRVVTKCKNCDTQTVITTIPATGHSYSSEVTTKATCTAEGVRTYTCAHDASHTYTEAIAKTQHIYEAGTAVAPTCTTSGYTPYKCKNCESNYVLITAPAKGHTFDTANAEISATCTADGSTTVKCNDCTETLSIPTEALGHTYVKQGETVPATCAEGAKETYKCSRDNCDATYTITVSAKSDDYNAHDWNDWQTVEQATNTSIGYKTRTCKICEKLEVEIIPATGEHKFDVETDRDPATCTDNGSVTYKCSTHTDCGLTSTVTLPKLGHTEELQYQAASCTAEGYAKRYCTRCNTTLEKETIDKLEHKFVNPVVTLSDCTNKGAVEFTCGYKCGATTSVEIPVNPDAHKLNTVTDPATCTKEGSVTVTCDNGCDYQKVTTLPKLQHSWSEWEKVDATNTTSGSWTRTCANGCTESLEIPAGGHNLVEDTEQYKAPKCNEKGQRVYKCTNHKDCPITVTVELDFAQHTPETKVVDFSCTTDGKIQTICTKCGAELYPDITLGKLQHNYVVISTTDPTCTSSGYTTYECSMCKDTYNKLGDAPVGHSIKMTDSQANCTTGDTVEVYCENCAFIQEVSVPALGHNYVLNGTTDATCAAAATETYKCSRCTASYTISVGEKKAHEESDWSEWTTVVEPTETTVGCKTRSCATCGQIQVETIEAIGEHRFADGELVNSQAPTCTANGYETRKCSVHTGANSCGMTSAITIPATGHKEEAIAAVDATCETNGSTAGTKCSVCDAVLVKPEVIAKLGHAWKRKSITPATCTAEGKIEYTCDNNCDETLEIAIDVDTNAHNLEKTTTAATCTENGKVTISCKNKNCTYKEEIVTPANGHVWNETASSTTDATCDNTGLEVYECNNCDAENQVVIPALGHDYEEKVVAPTCTTSGHTVYTCKNDAKHTYKVYDETAKAKGHTWGEWTVVTNATETTEGLKERECTVDGCTVKETEVIPAMMHEMTVLENVPSTCKQAGHVTYKCNIKHDGVDCDYTLTVDLPTVAHTLSTTVTEATCENTGLVVTKCTVDGCGYKLEDKVLALKPHTISLTYAYPTCTAEGYVKEVCDVCHDTINESTTARLGHDFSGTEKVTVTPDCTSTGMKEVKCIRCEETTKVELPANGHSYKPGTEVPATCTTSGYIPYECDDCDASYNKLTADPNGHEWNDTPKTDIPATCETNGKKVYECKNCNETNEVVVSKSGHSFVWKLVKNPTTTTEGLLVGTCVNGCGKEENIIIPVIDSSTISCQVRFIVNGEVFAVHTVAYGGGTTAPENVPGKAPDANGHYSLTWDKNFDRVMGDIDVNAIYVPKAHTYGDWVTVEEAACNKVGSKKRACTECGYEEFGTIETSDHNYKLSERKDPTCTENGYEDFICNDCNAAKREILRSLGHVMTYHEFVDASCTEEGHLAYFSCARCGNNYADRLGRETLTKVVIAVKPHTLVVVKGFEATCTTDGATDYKYCSVCDMIEKARVIPAYGHKDTNGDHVCDNCDGTYYEGGERVCSCSCHKTGILNELIFKIINFFWKLFGKNKSCACGKLHY